MRTYEIRSETVPEQLTAVARGSLRVAEIGPWLSETFGTVAASVAAQGIAPAGLPFARYGMPQGEVFEVEAGFPVAAPIEASGAVQPSSLPGGLVAKTTHVGPYEELQSAYQALHAYVESQGGLPTGGPWEVYLSDPTEEREQATWRTEVVQPYRRPDM